METTNMTDYLPQVRCTPEMKAGLVDIARNSVAPNIADHIRFAVGQYIAAPTGDTIKLTEAQREEMEWWLLGKSTDARFAKDEVEFNRIGQYLRILRAGKKPEMETA